MRRLGPLVLFFIVLCSGPEAGACLQGPDYNQVQAEKRDALADARALRNIVAASPSSDAYAYLNGPRNTLSEQKETDGLAEILAGRYAPAIALLQQAENAAPGRYSVAANLGTAYELNGQDEPALRWISEALSRNPTSHLGTEWVHVLILKAKLRRARAPSSAFAPLIALPAAFTGTTVVVTEAGRHSMNEVLRAVHYQLRERMKFVKPRDIYVADLLHTLARICSEIHGAESAYEYIKLAELYGASDQPGFQTDKSAYFKRVVVVRIFAGLWWLLKAFAALTFVYLLVRYPVVWLVRRVLRRGRAEVAP